MQDDRENIDAIRSDIRHTRERMGETAEALGAQLNPSRIKARVGESIREATIGKVQNMADNTREQVAKSGRNVAHVVRENPIPAALAAGGLGWLLYRGMRPSNGDSQVIELSETSVPRVPDESYSFGNREAAGSPVDKVSETARDVGDRISTGAKNVAEGAKHAAGNVADVARRQASAVGEKFEENPVTLGAIALAVGLAVGFAVPVTDKEQRLLGPKRDELMRKAREKVNETTEKVRHVAQEAGPGVRATIEDAARNEGLLRG